MDENMPVKGLHLKLVSWDWRLRHGNKEGRKISFGDCETVWPWQFFGLGGVCISSRKGAQKKKNWFSPFSSAASPTLVTFTLSQLHQPRRTNLLSCRWTAPCTSSHRRVTPTLAPGTFSSPPFSRSPALPSHPAFVCLSACQRSNSSRTDGSMTLPLPQPLRTLRHPRQHCRRRLHNPHQFQPSEKKTVHNPPSFPTLSETRHQKD